MNKHEWLAITFEIYCKFLWETNYGRQTEIAGYKLTIRRVCL